MAVRKRVWTWKGRERTAWVVDYFDSKGIRRLKTFKTKGAAVDWNAGTRIDLKQGVHVADADSVTVGKAGELWLAGCQARNGDKKLERSTLQQYRCHVELHITPLIGSLKLNKLTVPAIRAFGDRMREEGRSAALVRKVLHRLGSIVADAMERGSHAQPGA